MFNSRIAIALTCLVLQFVGAAHLVADIDKTEYMPNPNLGITGIPADLEPEYKKAFNRYTEIIAENGKPIRIFAQNRLRNEQIIRSRSILEHYLTNLADSKFGHDKSKIGNAMANNHAQLLLLNGADGEGREVYIDGQPLYENEIQVEGHRWYMNQSYDDHRDASYEEILHLVHDTGIGVDGINSLPGEAPMFQKAIRSAQVGAMKNRLWGVLDREWINELRRENSLSQEYLAAAIDAYYGLWGAWDEDPTKSMWGLFDVRDREAMKTKDAPGYAAITDFFHPYFTYNARIDENFKGVFSLRFNGMLPYTNHSRYLKDITLLGNHDIDVVVNELDNSITGNDGVNTVIFSGSFEEYIITQQTSGLIVKDLLPARDGVNTLFDIEQLQFSDQRIDTEN
ncbi:hypothetical protein KS4_25420 [Poriferisphaera corsica]|uniref:Lipoprotein n=1 Tax=Poriferisphaera corsica TaxID=2528020 RepID=A0A517YWA5_9BACT|nr:hypothetical protein [Poriferisphaera corsica]QDU34472.1 hypothetical protein KS4_25420 [Poriferisphaera corsica]